MAVEEHLGLRLEAVTNEWQAAFATAKVGAASLGRTVAATTTEFNKAESAAKKLGGTKWTDMATGLNSALDLVKKFSGYVKDAGALAHFSAEMKNLEARVPVERLRMMQEATEGAVDKVTLMKFSMRALSGEMHLTESGLDTVLKAANTLGDKGFGDTAENAEKLMEALRKGSSKGLREFGITLKDTSDKQANVNALMKDFTKLAGESPPVNEGLKEIERVQTAWGDFVVDVKAGLGGIILQLAEGIAKLTGLMDYSKSDKLSQRSTERARARTDAAIGQEGAWYTSGLGLEDVLTNRLNPGGAAERNQRGLDFQVARAQELAQAAHEMIWEDTNAAARKAVEDALRRSKDKGKQWAGKMPGGGGGGAGKKTSSDWGSGYLRQGLLEGDRALSRGIDWGRGVLANASNFETPDFDLSGAGLDALGGGSQGGGDKLGQIYTDLSDKTTAVGAAYETLSAGIVASVDAAISGNDAIGRAALKAVQSTLKAIALESTARAAFEGAMALASLAIGNGPGAATHGKAAASFAIAAAIAGVSSATAGAFAGAGGGSPSAYGGPSSQPGGGNYTGSRAQSSGAVNYTLNFYGTIAAGSKREVSEAVAGAVDQARRVGTSRSEQSLTVRFE